MKFSLKIVECKFKKIFLITFVKLFLLFDIFLNIFVKNKIHWTKQKLSRIEIKKIVSQEHQMVQFIKNYRKFLMMNY